MRARRSAQPSSASTLRTTCLALLLGACGDKGTEAGEGGQYLLVDYLGFELDAAWTYRDDGSDEAPEEDSLIRALMEEQDTLRFRRGARWADAEYVGELVFDTRYGLNLTGFELPTGEGSGDWPMADFDPTNGEYQGSGTWGCQADTTAEVEVWYATFDEVLRLECTSTDGRGPAGTWDFALGVGLVRYEQPDGVLLELVAPY